MGRPEKVDSTWPVSAFRFVPSSRIGSGLGNALETSQNPTEPSWERKTEMTHPLPYCRQRFYLFNQLLSLTRGQHQRAGKLQLSRYV